MTQRAEGRGVAEINGHRVPRIYNEVTDDLIKKAEGSRSYGWPGGQRSYNDYWAHQRNRKQDGTQSTEGVRNKRLRQGKVLAVTGALNRGLRDLRRHIRHIRAQLGSGH